MAVSIENDKKLAYAGGILLLRSRGLLRTCRIWESSEELRPQDNQHRQRHRTLTGCFSAGELTRGVCLVFTVAALPGSRQPLHTPLITTLKLLADDPSGCNSLPDLDAAAAHTRVCEPAAWLQVVEAESASLRTQRTTMRVRLEEPVSVISFRLDIESYAPVCTVRISAMSPPMPACPKKRARAVRGLPFQFQAWLGIVPFVSLETALKLSVACKDLRQVVEMTFAGSGSLVSRFVQRHMLDERNDIREFTNPIEDCFIFALEDQWVFASERAEFANLLLNAFTFSCDLSTEPVQWPVQLFYGARHERLSSGPSLTFETWIDREAKHTMQLIVIRPPISGSTDPPPCTLSLQMRLLPSLQEEEEPLSLF